MDSQRREMADSIAGRLIPVLDILREASDTHSGNTQVRDRSARIDGTTAELFFSSL